MARTFGSYSPQIPLGTTWEETFRFVDEDGLPVSLVGCNIRAQIRDREVVRDAVTGLGDSNPLIELVNTLSLYPVLPSWPVKAAFAAGLNPSTPDPSDGYIRQRVEAADTWLLSPTNRRKLLLWDIEIIDTADNDAVIPLITGRPLATPRRTLGLPA